MLSVDRQMTIYNTGVARKPNIENETGNKGQACYCCDELLGRGFGGLCGGPKVRELVLNFYFFNFIVFFYLKGPT